MLWPLNKNSIMCTYFLVLCDKCACAVSKWKMCSLVITVLATKLLLLLFQRCFGKKIFDCLCTIGLGQQSHSKRETEGKLVERNIGTVRHVDQTNRGNKQKHCLPFIALF